MNSVPQRSPWVAELDLGFERRAARTVLAKNRHLGPLQVQKVLYPEGPDTCHVVILHPPGGIAASDRLAIRASFARDSHALLTTPGATKWYRSEGEWARQEIGFSLQEHAVVEWLPRENIYYEGSRVRAGLDVSLADGARFFGWDIVSLGRRASGERWTRGGFDVRTSVRQGTRRLWSELARVEAESGFAQSPVGLAGAAVYGSFLAAGVAVDAELACWVPRLAARRRRQPVRHHGDAPAVDGALPREFHRGGVRLVQRPVDGTASGPRAASGVRPPGVGLLNNLRADRRWN